LVNAGTWALPGGHLEFGESFETCAEREVLEETGLKISDVRFLTAVNSVMGDENKHYVTIFMGAHIHENEEPKVSFNIGLRFVLLSYCFSFAFSNIPYACVFLLFRVYLAALLYYITYAALILRWDTRLTFTCFQRFLSRKSVRPGNGFRGMR
jgi:ADP-ribose pyrophosphatase YjhB (NUDIX family)